MPTRTAHANEGTSASSHEKDATPSATGHEDKRGTAVQESGRKKLPAWKRARQARAEAIGAAFQSRPGMIQRLADRLDLSPQFVASWASGSVAFYEEDVLCGEAEDYATYSAILASRKRGEARADERLAAWEAALAQPEKTRDPVAVVLDIGAGVGELQAEIRDANADGVIEPHEAERIVAKAGGVERNLVELKRNVGGKGGAA